MRIAGMIAFLTVFAIAGICRADEIKGRVSSVDKSQKTLRISGVIIQAGDAWIENEQDYPLALKDVVPEDFVAVEGKFTGSSEMSARKIELNNPECGVVKGKISSIDVKKREIVISGIMIKVPADTWLEGPDRVRIPLELFAPGYSVECRGGWTRASELTAFKLTVE